MTEATFLTTSSGDLIDRALIWFTNNIAWFDPMRPTLFQHPSSRFSPLLELLHLRRLLERRGRLWNSPASRDFAEATSSLALRLAPQLQSLPHPGPSAYYLAWLDLEITAATRVEAKPLNTAGRLVLARNLLPDGPYSDLEHAYVCSSLAVGVMQESRFDLFEGWLSTRNYQHSITADQCYEFTHAVFYISDFGLLKPVIPHCAAAAWLASRMLQASLATEQVDLTAELLLALSILDPRSGPMTEPAWSLLNDAQRLTGEIPGPLFDPRECQQQTQDEVAAYIAATCYHTTLVACIAAADRSTLREALDKPGALP